MSLPNSVASFKLKVMGCYYKCVYDNWFHESNRFYSTQALLKQALSADLDRDAVCFAVNFVLVQLEQLDDSQTVQLLSQIPYLHLKPLLVEDLQTQLLHLLCFYSFRGLNCNFKLAMNELERLDQQLFAFFRLKQRVKLQQTLQ